MKTFYLPLLLFISTAAIAQNTGIGTTMPMAKLEVEASSSITIPQLLLTEQSADFSRLMFRNKSQSRSWSIAAKAGANLQDDRLNIYHSTTGDILQIDGFGLVGIGTAPSIGSRLAVKSTSGNALMVTNNSAVTPALFVEAEASGGTAITAQSSSGIAARFTSSTGTALQLDGTNGKALTTFGKSGFGTINPLEMVDVNGGLKLGNTATTNAGTIRFTGNDFEGFTGTEWKSLTGGSGGGSSPWTVYGPHIYNNNTGSVGIGVIPASATKLDVASNFNTSANINNTNQQGTGLNVTAIGTAGKFQTGSGIALFANATNPDGRGLVISQGKTGLGILNPTEQLDVNGAVRIGSTTSSNPGTIRYNGDDLQGYVDGQWKSLTAKSSGGGSSSPVNYSFKAIAGANNNAFAAYNTFFKLPYMSISTIGYNFNGVLSDDGKAIFTAPANGVYHFDVHLTFYADQACQTKYAIRFLKHGSIDTDAQKNGVLIFPQDYDWQEASASKDFMLTAGDTIEVEYLVGAPNKVGVNMIMSGSVGNLTSSFSGFLVGGM